MLEHDTIAAIQVIRARIAAGLHVDPLDLDAALADVEKVMAQPNHRATRANAIRARNQALRQAADLLLGPGRARPLARAIRAYVAGRWRRDSLQLKCPSDLIGTAEGHIWQALRCHEDNFPKGYVQLGKIVGD